MKIIFKICLLLLIVLFPIRAFALEGFTYSIGSNPKIGSYGFNNINDYFVVNPGDGAFLPANFTVWISNVPPDNHGSFESDPFRHFNPVHFSLDYCDTGLYGDFFDLYSSNDNHIDFYYNTGNKCNAGNDTNGDVYRTFFTLKPSSYNDGTQINYPYGINFEDVTFAFRNRVSWQEYFRLLSINVYSTEDYNSLLNMAKSGASADEMNKKLDELNTNLNNGFNSLGDRLTGALEQFKNSFGQKQDETNKKLDDISDMQPTTDDKPDSGSFDDYSNGEKQLLDSVKDVDISSSLDIGIDSKSSSFVWDNITSFINTHSSIFGMFIAILSLGIIKLALGR